MNKIYIKRLFSNKPIDTIYLGVAFLHKWRVLIKEPEKSKVEELLKALLKYAKMFRPVASCPSVVGFI
jgi:hypothetical protein